MGGKGSRVTINDIARRAGVSKAAVSFALNGRPGVADATRKRILEVAKEASWAPDKAASSLTRGGAGAVGMVVRQNPEVVAAETWHIRLITGLETTLANHGVSLLLRFAESMREELETIESWVESRAVDAVVLLDSEENDPRIQLLETRAAVPYVVNDAGGIDFSLDFETTAKVVTYLVKRGATRIARVGGTPDLAHVRARDRGFVETARDLGVEASVYHACFLPEEAAKVTRELLRMPRRPDAIVFDNDIMALAGISVANAEGVAIPKTLMAVAWDDSVMCKFASPSLTAVNTWVYEMACAVAVLVLRALGHDLPIPVSTRPTLIERESTARGFR